MQKILALRGDNHQQVLEQAQQVRAAQNVPLIGDERWSQQHWDQLVARMKNVDVPANTAWASFTSGSTTTPRIIMRSAASWDISFPTLSAAFDLTSADQLLIPVHPVSSMATYSLAWALHADITWRATRHNRLVAGDLGQATLIHATPWQAREVLNLIQAGTPHRLRGMLVGGDALEPTLRTELEAHGIRVISYYGAAELSMVAWNTGDGLRAFPGVQIRVERDTLWVKSDQVCSAVVGAGGSFHIDDGWASVGDQARYNTDGTLKLLGRADSAIMTAGATVPPGDVESVFNAHPAISGSLVVGAPDKVLGQRVVAFIELAPGASATELPAVINQVKDQLTAAQRPRAWRVVTGLPKTTIGKVKRLTYQQAFDLEVVAQHGAIR